MPWAEPNSRFTLLFETLAIRLLLEASNSAVARLLGISWDEAQEASRRIAGGVRGTVLVSLGDAEREIVHAWRPRIESALADARAELEALERQAGR